MRARGTSRNPANRFETLRYTRTAPELGAGDAGVWDDEEPEPDSDPRTVLLADASRSIVATNASPDVGFDASVNPYRGCEHGCAYCLGGNTRILYADMVWRPLGEVRVGDLLVGFDEECPAGRTRKLRPAMVEAVWWSKKPTLRLITRNSEVVATAEHRWLQGRDFRWSQTDRLAAGRQLRHMPVVSEEAIDDDYRVGYVAGLSLGDGTFRYQPGWRSSRLGFPAAYWRVALVDLEPLERLVDFLARFGVPAFVRPFDAGKGGLRPMRKVEIRSLERLAVVSRMLTAEIESRSYRRGFVAGFFDAEGCNSTSLRFSQVDIGVLERVRRYSGSLGFEFKIEPRPERVSMLRLVGSVQDRIRFFGVLRPAIRRKRDRLFGRMPPLAPEHVEAVERGAPTDVVDIQTSTGTFYAEGLATHNCYARPTHETLGFSAGLDFETRILVKRDAPELLARRLAAPSWRPQTLALSGVTDPYQPAERRLELTRRCLRVLADFRNPVVVVTKSWLVTRDLDVLAELAGEGAASVLISVTSLDATLQHRLEPRASRPAKRLAAIERLAAAGIPVGVLVAPVIPGLTDQEIPAILQRAADAGAGFAGKVLLRLPHGVKELFADWLGRHAPERREKVLSRLRALHQGRLYDARFGRRQRGTGVFAEQIDALFDLARRRAGLGQRGPELSTASFRRPAGAQLALFGGRGGREGAPAPVS